MDYSFSLPDGCPTYQVWDDSYLRKELNEHIERCEICAGRNKRNIEMAKKMAKKLCKVKNCKICNN